MAKNYLTYSLQRSLEEIIRKNLADFDQLEDGTPTGAGCVYRKNVTDGRVASDASELLGRPVTVANVFSLRTEVFGQLRKATTGGPRLRELAERIEVLEARLAKIEELLA